MSKRVRLTSRDRSAVEDNTPYPGTVNQPDRTFKKRDQYDNWEEVVNHPLPDMRHEWKNDARDDIGFGIPEGNPPTVASIRVAANKAVRLAVLLLGEKVGDEVVEDQARDFMGMSQESLDRSLERFAETQTLYEAEDKGKEEEDKAAETVQEEVEEDAKKESSEKEPEAKEETASEEPKEETASEETKEVEAEDKQEEAKEVEAEDKTEETKEEVKASDEETKEVEAEDKTEAKEETASDESKAVKAEDDDEDEEADEDDDEESKEASDESKEVEAEDKKEETASDESKEETASDEVKSPNELDIELTSSTGDLEPDTEADARLAQLFEDERIPVATQDDSQKAGIKTLGGQPKVAARAAEAADIGSLWGSAPDVSEVFE